MMDHQYACEKLSLLLRDLDTYSDDEFWRQMSRIAGGATGTDHAEEIAKERDALAANVERLQEGLSQALVHWGAHCTDEDGAAYAECERRCDEAPTTSLARLKAGWQAAAVETAVITAQMKGETEVARWLQDLADTFRRQAEGGTDGEA